MQIFNDVLLDAPLQPLLCIQLASASRCNQCETNWIWWKQHVLDMESKKRIVTQGYSLGGLRGLNAWTV